MNVQLYLDESGHSKSHEYVVVAGVIGTSEAWDGFDVRWNGILTGHGVVPPFHMTDFEAKRGQFKCWAEEKQRRPLMKGLMDEISGRLLFLCGAAVFVPWFRSFDWRRAFPGAEPPEDPYHLAMQDVIREAVTICTTGSRVPATSNELEVVMGEQKEFQGRAAAYYRAAHHFDVTGTLTSEVRFVKPRDCPPLQAADIAAFELRWRLTRPDLQRYPWIRFGEKGADLVFLRGIDPKKVFSEREFASDDHRSLVLRGSTLGRVPRR